MAYKINVCGLDTSQLRKLSREESDEMIRKAKSGDAKAREEFIMANLRLVLSIVQRFSARNGCADDMFQVGTIGLIKAVDNFNVDYNLMFSTYAVPMIIGEIRRYLREKNAMKVSRSLRDTAYKVLKAREKLTVDGKEPQLFEIANEIEMTVREVSQALDAVSEPVSLYDFVYSDEDDGISYIEQIADVKSNEESWSERVALNDAMKKIPERERKILTLRYYVGKTQTEISKIVGISQAQVSRLEKSALKRMKEMIG